MGFIYKITNLTNNKCYIGQTNRYYKERWKEHLRDKNKEPYSNWALYRMLNKTPEEKVKWEVLEEIDNQFLNERERYWIEYYNSCENGYNITYGGSQGTKYNYKEIYDFWRTDGERNFTKTGNSLNIPKNTVSRIISSFGESRRTWEEINSQDHDSLKRKVNQIDPNTGKVILTFNSLTEAAEYLGDKDYRKTLSNICKGIRPTFKGYCWQYAEDIGNPIYLNKQIKSIFLPEYDLIFETKQDCSKWFIDNNISKSKNEITVSNSISYALKHSGIYRGIRLEEKEKVIYSYYDKK